MVTKVIPDLAEMFTTLQLRGSLSQGYGLRIGNQMHRHGVNVRHMGLLRDYFWRPLIGTVDIAFNTATIKTNHDLREQLERGIRVKVKDKM